MKKLYSLTLAITLMALLSACGGNSKSGADSEHGLVNTPPAAESQNITTGKNRQRTISLKATDANADKLSYRITTPPKHGTLSGTAPVLTYRPDRDYVGEDSFAFVVSDGMLDSDEVTVSIIIGDDPIGGDDNSTGGSDDNSSAGSDGNASSGGDGTATDSGNDHSSADGADDNTSDDTGGNGSTGGSDNNATGGTDSNGSIGSDDNASSGNDDNASTGGDNNSSAGGSDNNGSAGSDDNASSGNDGNSSTGSDDNGSTGGGSHTAAIKSLKLEIADTALNRDHNTTITFQALYDDNTTKTPTNVEWLITPKDAVKIEGNTLTALKDTNVTLQVKAGNTLSNRVKLAIYWEVNGHRLPPEPDPKVNNATLLGIDANHNDVRDDVERWIYDRYKDKHPIYIDIAMQAGRAYKQVLETPERAKEIRESVNAPYFCGSYYQNYAKFFKEPHLVQTRIDAPVKSKYFNTKTRSDIYWQYDKLLSGDSYALPKIREMKKQCDFNTLKYDKE